MSLAEVKQQVVEMTEDERLELQALLVCLDRKNDPAYIAEMERRMREMDAGKKYSYEQLLHLHQELVAQGR